MLTSGDPRADHRRARNGAGETGHDQPEEQAAHVAARKAMRYHNDILSTIGHTPLVRLNRLSEGLRPLILSKVELTNPGGSVKDR
ncbi:MAG TPA: hypothetical protein VF807_03555, partial [Ktedonobacterales bacterium]